MSETPAYVLGQRVWIYDVNARGNAGPEEGRVTKVGRTLVTVEWVAWPTWRPRQFRIDGGAINDNYGHQWIKTDEQRQVDDHRSALLRRLHEAGIEFRVGRTMPTAVIEGFVKVLDGIGI